MSKGDLKKILEDIGSDIFTPEIQEEISKLVESKCADADAAGYKRAFEKLDEEHATKLQETVEKLDEDHASKLAIIIEKIDEDHTEKLKQLVEKIDEDHTEKLNELVEKIDEDHTGKLQKLIEMIDEDHTEKLKEVKDFYESIYEEKLVEKIDAFLEAVLEEKIPAEQIVDSIELKRLKESFEKMREILVINDDFVQTEVREAVEDAADQLKTKQDDIDRLIGEKVSLVNKIKKIEAQQVLEEKTKDMMPAKKKFIMKFFERASVDEISQRLDEAIKAFDEDEDQNRQESQKRERGTLNIPPATLVTESIEEGEENNGKQYDDNIVNQVTQMLNRSFRARH